ncbi:MAG: LEA type 2 family protein [Chitinophaga sp.]|uniref:NDR1/HIN1-like protein n=1 Tax=Chitinophaga sp. TaxID=1869181 RepID=UPI001B0DEBB2|nr:LEA type 2 family protein [Chitinophaga sp.]MBO9730856.1 LEA type 2 family protein [Chitinophaga sp.]
MKVYKRLNIQLPAKWKMMVLALAAAMALPSCTFFKTPEARLPRKLPVKLFGLAPERLALRVDGVYYNPNDYGFTFTGGELDLKVDSFYLGHVKIDTVMTIPAHAMFTVPVVVEPDFEKFSNSGVNVNDSVIISFSGTMNGKAKGISKKINISYKGKHMLDISI